MVRNIKNKSKATFIQFDIIDFYPISKEVLIDSIYYAKEEKKQKQKKHV